MKIKKNFVFRHPELGIGIVLKSGGDSSWVYFSKNKRSVEMDNSLIINLKDDNLNVQEICLSGVLEPLFDRGTKERAQDYYLGDDNIIFTNFSDLLISVKIKGTYIYNASIHLENSIIMLSCSCPVESYCKHLYALIQVIKRYHQPSMINSNDSDDKLLIGSEINFDTLDRFEKIREYYLNMSGDDLYHLFENCSVMGIRRCDLGALVLILDENICHKLPYATRTNAFFKELFKFKETAKFGNKYFYFRFYNSSNVYLYLLYSIIQRDYSMVSEIINYPSLDSNTKKVIAFYFNSLVNHVNNKYLYNAFSATENIIYTYEHIEDDEIKKNFYLRFNNELNKKGIYRYDINDYDIYLNLKEQISAASHNKKTIKEYLSLCDSMNKINKQVDYLSFMLKESSLVYGPYNRDVFTLDDIKTVIRNLNDNEILMKLFEEEY